MQTEYFTSGSLLTSKADSFATERGQAFFSQLTVVRLQRRIVVSCHCLLGQELLSTFRELCRNVKARSVGTEPRLFERAVSKQQHRDQVLCACPRPANNWLQRTGTSARQRLSRSEDGTLWQFPAIPAARYFGKQRKMAGKRTYVLDLLMQTHCGHSATWVRRARYEFSK